jgi:hypothetical protein
MLYNFHDGPADLFERMRLNVALNEELGVRIWSFPMRYQPTDRPDRGHIGERWTRYQLRSLQIVLQATHGVVSGEPQFFKRAFGDTQQQFEDILAMPHDFIFNRDWYERLDGRAEYDEYSAYYSRLSVEERAELIQLLSSCDPRHFGGLANRTPNRRLKAVLPFYIPVAKTELKRMWKIQRQVVSATPTVGLAEDEMVEDAGLESDVDMAPPALQKRAPRQARTVVR